MQEIQVTVLAVQGRQAGSKTVYDVSTSDGVKYQAWEPELAAQANALIGQLVSARVETTTNSKNGRTYTNHTLREIGLPGTLAPQAQPAVPGTPVVPVPINPVVQAVPVSNGVANIPMAMSEDERQKLIVRQNVLRTALDFIGSLYQGAGPEALEQSKGEAFVLAGELFKKVYAAPQAPAVPVTTPADVAEQVNAASETGAAVAVGAEPEW